MNTISKKSSLSEKSERDFLRASEKNILESLRGLFTGLSNHTQMVGGDVPLYMKFWAKLTHPVEKRRLRIVIARSVSAVTPSDKSSIITQSTKSFPMILCKLTQTTARLSEIIELLVLTTIEMYTCNMLCRVVHGLLLIILTAAVFSAASHAAHRLQPTSVVVSAEQCLITWHTGRRLLHSVSTGRSPVGQNKRQY